MRIKTTYAHLPHASDEEQCLVLVGLDGRTAGVDEVESRGRLLLRDDRGGDLLDGGERKALVDVFSGGGFTKRPVVGKSRDD
jgi:hypothetical protein